MQKINTEGSEEKDEAVDGAIAHEKKDPPEEPQHMIEHEQEDPPEEPQHMIEHEKKNPPKEPQVTTPTERDDASEGYEGEDGFADLVEEEQALIKKLAKRTERILNPGQAAVVDGGEIPSGSETDIS